jgi:hypothetical protein
LLVKENYPDAEKFLTQRNGNYDFEGASMQTVADELGRQYGVHINVDPRVANNLYYGHLNTTRLIGTELDVLCTVMDNTRWQKVGNQYYIREIRTKH